VDPTVINNQIQTGTTGILRASILASKEATSTTFYRLLISPTSGVFAPTQSRKEFTATLQQVVNGVVVPWSSPPTAVTIRTLDFEQAIVKNVVQSGDNNVVFFAVDNLVGTSLNTTVRIETSTNYRGANGQILRVDLPISSQPTVDLSQPPRLSSYNINSTNLNINAQNLVDSDQFVRIGGRTVYNIPGELRSVTFLEIDTDGSRTNRTVSLTNLPSYLDQYGYNGVFRVENSTDDTSFDLRTFNGEFDILIPLENIVSSTGNLDSPDFSESVASSTTTTTSINGISRSIDIRVFVEGVENQIQKPFTPPNETRPTTGGGGGSGNKENIEF
jgi:hypothetical protein